MAVTESRRHYLLGLDDRLAQAESAAEEGFNPSLRRRALSLAAIVAAEAEEDQADFGSGGARAKLRLAEANSLISRLIRR